MTRKLRVIKLGGSLLSRPNWREDFLAWYGDAAAAGGRGSVRAAAIPQALPQALPNSAARTEPRPPVAASDDHVDILIVGGGEPVNALRELADRVAMDDSTAHWIAIEFMSANARMVADRLGCPLVEFVVPALAGKPERLPAKAGTTNAHLQVLDPALILQTRQIRLEESWSVTSDSIAAAVASACEASELVLVKSKQPPGNCVKELAKIGYVDESFPTAAATLLNVRFTTI